MDDESNLENRYKLVMELNTLLEEIVNVNKQLRLMKQENFNLLIQNIRSNEKNISEYELLLSKLKERNEFLSKEQIKINNDIEALKQELNYLNLFCILLL